MNQGSIEVPPDAGELYAQERGKPVPGFNHARTQSRLIKLLPNDDRYEVLSELNLELNGWRCVPDITIYPRGAGLLASDIAWVTEIPVTVVEILCLRETMGDMMNEVDRLLVEGVPSVWLVIPAVRVVTIFQKDHPPLSALHGNLTDPVSGITVDVGDLFV